MSADENDGGWTALDDNIVGDGTADATSKPLDTMLEKIVDARRREVWHRGSTVTHEWYNPSGPESDPRPFTSRDKRAALMCIPWDVRPGLDEIHVSLKAEVGNDDSNTTGEVELVLELGPQEQNSPRKAITATATGGQTAYTITLDLSSRSFARETKPLVLWVKSTASAKISEEDFGTPDDTGKATLILYQDGSAADDALDEKTAVKLTKYGELPNAGVLLPLHKSPVDFDDHYTGVTAEVPQSAASANDLQTPVIDLSWVKPQSVAIDARFDKTESEGAFVAKPPRTMEPQQAIKGADAATHPETLDGVVRRARCRATGPHGQDQGTDWPSDYYRQWSWIETQDGFDTPLDRTTFRPRYDSSQIRCIAYVKPFFDIKILSERFSASDQSFKAAPPEPDKYADYVITADLDLKLTARQAQSSASWANQPSTSTARTVRDVSLHDARRQAGYPLPNTVFWARHPEGLQSFTNVDFSSEYRYTWYEGALFEADFQLFPRTGYPISIDPTDGLSLNAGEPLRCDLEFDGWSQGPNLDEIDTPSDDYEVSYHLLCLGTSWWEVPQV